jgi:demethylmenaquinone methyltransferase/2-methoxy-6-polyprenyl-1,4-benzoquinol methylase
MNNEDKEIKDEMEKMVDKYDAYMRRTTLGREDALRSTTVGLAQIKPGDNVLEVGCGTGTLTLAAKRKAGPSGKVCGIDIIPGMIERSRQKAARAGLDVDFGPGSIEAIPFPDNTFDAVMCSFMIFHMSDEVRRRGIAEIHRVLKPEGRLLVIDIAAPEAPVSKAIAKLFLGFMLDHDLEELVPLMEEAGFMKTERLKVNFRIMGLPVLAALLGRKQKL